MFRAVIFDFDGVIADSEYLHFKAFNLALEEYGVVISQEKYYSDYLGFSDADFLPAMTDVFSLDLSDVQRQELLARKARFFEELASEESSIFEGVAEFIYMLESNGIRMAICSGALGDEIELMLDGSGLRGSFEFIVSADDVSKGKPDPEGFLKALAGLSANSDSTIASEECVVIEDSHWGLEAGCAAGMRCVAVSNTYLREELEGAAAMVVERLDELRMSDLKRLCNEK